MFEANAYPRWWHTWFSPATVVLVLTCLGVLWTTSSRLTSIENEQKAVRELRESDLSQIKARLASLEGQVVTKEWLQREIQFQQQSYASKGSVDLIGQRLEEFQRQLNDIQGSVRQLAETRRVVR